jgi:hypothetical protein
LELFPVLVRFGRTFLVAASLLLVAAGYRSESMDHDL